MVMWCKTLSIIILVIFVQNGCKCKDFVRDVSFEFRFFIAPLATECFYQHLQPGYIFHAIFNVIKGGDHKLHVDIFDPQFKVLYTDPEVSFHWYDNQNITVEGAYEICFRNTGYYEKYVYLSVVSYDIQDVELNEKMKEEHEVTNELIWKYVHNITNSVSQIHNYQVVSHMSDASDYYSIENVSSYVVRFSLLQCFVIMLSGLVQVYFIKRLFGTQDMSSKHYRPKA